jgi:DNA-binding helix-hairpin-helix protein with protein kinase domain
MLLPSTCCCSPVKKKEKINTHGMYPSLLVQLIMRDKYRNREAVTIDKDADSKQNEWQGWKASARNQKHLEQREAVTTENCNCVLQAETQNVGQEPE